MCILYLNKCKGFEIAGGAYYLGKCMKALHEGKELFSLLKIMAYTKCADFIQDI